MSPQCLEDVSVPSVEALVARTKENITKSKMLKINPNLYNHAYFITLWCCFYVYQNQCDSPVCFLWALVYFPFSLSVLFFFFWNIWNEDVHLWKRTHKKNELNAKREQILPFMYSIFNLISHFIFMMNNRKCADVFFGTNQSEISEMRT